MDASSGFLQRLLGYESSIATTFKTKTLWALLITKAAFRNQNAVAVSVYNV